MWFMTHILNPIVRLILRSPLHLLLSAAVMLITVRGRKSGKEYTIPVQYVQSQDDVYVVPGTPERKTWWRNLRGGAPVSVRLRGRDLNAQAAVLAGEADRAAIAEALRQFLRRFPAAARSYQVRRMPDGMFNAEDIQAAASRLIVVRLALDD
jgi:deazaflavin-dependent oxidoreductase (nitroreductase family)